jgi:L-threonylcarbamoyladenylate synthase
MQGKDIQTAANYLAKGGVVAYATEAVFGLGCDPHNASAIQKILTIKNRPRHKGVILISGCIEHFEPLLQSLPEEKVKQMSASWFNAEEIAQTWVLPDPHNLYSSWVKGDHTKVAIRVSKHPQVKALSKIFGGPIVSTSANPAKMPAIRKVGFLQQWQKKAGYDYLLVGETLGFKQASRISEILEGNQIRS